MLSQMQNIDAGLNLVGFRLMSSALSGPQSNIGQYWVDVQVFSIL